MRDSSSKIQVGCSGTKRQRREITPWKDLPLRRRTHLPNNNTSSPSSSICQKKFSIKVNKVKCSFILIIYHIYFVLFAERMIIVILYKNAFLLILPGVFNGLIGFILILMGVLSMFSYGLLLITEFPLYNFSKSWTKCPIYFFNLCSIFPFLNFERSILRVQVSCWIARLLFWSFIRFLRMLATTFLSSVSITENISAIH